MIASRTASLARLVPFGEVLSGRLDAPGSAWPRVDQAAAAHDRTELGTAVRLRGVHKRFGARDVLRGLDLDIAPGSFVAVVGRSGGGKSTMLRLVAGLEAADAGAVTLDGVALAGLAPHTTVMFQDPRLLPWQRVVSNFGIARQAGWRRDAMDALREVGLQDRAQDWPAVLSGGQKQRVALARALTGHPRLLLLDEPLSALDALTRGDMQRLIDAIWARQGFTAILVTHDVAEAVALSDRVIVLRDGAIALDLPIPLPRPRLRASAETAALEATILEQLLT